MNVGTDLMNKEQKLENLSPLHQPPDEPYFDDEITILKARPVVPLKQFDDRLQRKRKWFLFGMCALAMFLGAASGLGSAYFKLREVSEEPVIQLAVPALSVSEEPLPVSQGSDTNNGLANLLPSLPFPEERHLKLFTPKRPIRARRVSIKTKPLVPLPSSMSEEEELLRIRAALLTDDLKRGRVRPTERRELRRF